MGVIRIPQNLYEEVREHLFTLPGEHFAYFLARWSDSGSGPIFLVEDLHLVPDEDVATSWDAWEVSVQGYLPAINKAVRSKRCLIELHNHFLPPPRFSQTDREGFTEFVPYIHKSIPNRPYGATVWTDGEVYGEYFLPNGQAGKIDSITIYGGKLTQLVSGDKSQQSMDVIYNRQIPWFTQAGQRQIERLKVGIVGLGGTGAHAAQQLAYLGFREFVLVDPDIVEKNNLNRLVTATQSDIGSPKVTVAASLIHKVRPDAKVDTFHSDIREKVTLEALPGIDILFGCVDNDGARLIMNELAVSYHIPYFDIGVGIHTSNGKVSSAGGYVNTFIPGGPCLICSDSIDQEEASYFLAKEEQREFQRDQGYISGLDTPAPAVVSLNGLLVSAAINELLVYISGIRPVVAQQLYDLIGRGRPIPGQWVTPSRVSQLEGCVHCGLAGTGDDADIKRYVE